MVKDQNKKSKKLNDLVVLLSVLLMAVLLNYISSFLFFRLDLTAEKRYSLTEPTKELISSLDDQVFFKVYLKGEFPAGFKRLQEESREMLNEFRAQKNGDKIQYEFINPSESEEEEIRTEIYKQLYKKGLRPTDLEIKDEDGISQKIIWPGAIVSYKGREIALDLLQTKLGSGPEDVLNSSIENLEYALSNAIVKLAVEDKPKIGFIYGHGELDELHTLDIANSLSEFYVLERVKIDGRVEALTRRNDQTKDSSVKVYNAYDAIVIAKPDSQFSEKDKYVIDQYIMYGGKVLWMIDPIQASMDSLLSSDVTMGIANNLNLEDQLFTYGVRMNSDLLMDVQSAMIPLPVGMLGNQPRFELFPWFYFPLLNPTPGHPIVNNLNVVKTEFASSIDFVGEDQNRKEVLLSSSPYSKKAYAPVRISLGITRFEPKREQYNLSNVPVAGLVEGRFKSVFAGRLTKRFQDSKHLAFREISDSTKMVVVADGDIIKNHVREDGNILPLGVDKYTKQEYGNKDFIVNVINYLCGQDELMVVRSRTLRLRLLDKTKVRDERLQYQLVNMVLPSLLIIAFGIAFNFYRRKKYSNEE